MTEKRSQREINRPSQKNSGEYFKAKQEQLAETERIKTQYLEAVREFYNIEKAKNPNFRLSINNLENYIKMNPDKFPGITSYHGLKWYFNSSIASLEIALGIRSVMD